MIVGLALGVLYCIFSLMGMPAVGAVTQDVVHPRLKGISWGMTMFSMFMLGGAWGPVVLGALSDYLGGGSRGLQIAMMITVSGWFFWGTVLLAELAPLPGRLCKGCGLQDRSGEVEINVRW
ncbi:MAG: hypothetical protein MZV70_03130 [Desulfobacterales bacterium]|nr:hypothetical protein [Desulfobacterales bacterium]